MPNYNTVTELRAYATARGITLDPDDAIVLTQQTRAHDYLESQSWQGKRTDSAQADQWPRSGVYVDGQLIADDTVPDISGGASILAYENEIAIAISQGYDPMAPLEPTIRAKTETVDVITESVEYAEGSASRTIAVAPNRFAYKLLSSGGGFGRLRVVNA